ncbi:MAG: DUF885 domain-containing protein [Solobacterium sp.]|nr:DUF885 domain-containing protein [Solobacterium sp.]
MKKMLRILHALLLSLFLTAGAFVPVMAENEDFDAFMEEEARDLLSVDFGSFHFNVVDYKRYGLTKPEITLLHPSYESYAAEAASMQESLDRLHQFDYNSLNDTQKHDYLAYEDYLKSEIALDQFPDFIEFYNPRSGKYSSLITSLTEFILYDRESADDYLACMEDLPASLHDMNEFTKQQAAKGHFMPDSLLDEALASMQNFIDKGEDNPLIILYDKKIDNLEGLSEEEKTSYKERNRDIIVNTVYPAIQDTRSFLETLRGSRSVSGSNFEYPDGKAYYEALATIKCSTDISLDAKRDYLAKCLSDLFQYQITHMSNPFAKVSGFTTAEELIAYLSEHLEDFPKGPDINYTISYLDPCVANPNVMAYYLTPTIDSYTENVMRINGDNVKNNLNTMFTTLAHEGLPGHMYQFTWYYSQPDTTLLRHAISSIGYGEGWAQYGQRIMLHRSSLSEADAEYQAITLLSAYTMQAYIDMLVNGYGLDAKAVTEQLKAVGMEMSEENVKEAVDGVIYAPGQTLPYGFGQCKMWEFHERVRGSLGDAFNLEEFHLQILQHGQRFFEVVEDDLQKYVESKGAEFKKDFTLFEYSAVEPDSNSLIGFITSHMWVLLVAAGLVILLILGLLFLIIRGIIRMIKGKKQDNNN